MFVIFTTRTGRPFNIYFMSVTAFLGNALILISLHKESSLHPPSKLLLRSLATTDLFVGLISQPLFATYCISIANEHSNMFRYASSAALATASIFCGVSVLTVTAISVDRLLALLLGLRYKQVVTLKRTYVIVIAIWVECTVCSAMQFLTELPDNLMVQYHSNISVFSNLALLLHKDIPHLPSSSK